MSELAIEQASRHSNGSFDPIGAHSAHNRPAFAYPALFSLILLTVFLIVVGILTGRHLRSQNDEAMLYAALGNASIPMLYWSRTLCNGSASAVRLRRDDLLAE